MFNAHVPLLGLLLTSPALAGSTAKVDICHWNANSASVITVAASAVPAHFAHGDSYPGVYYVDADGDGYGDALGGTDVCPNAGFAAEPTDCDDTDANVFPTNEESDDLVDNDCDLWVDEDFVMEGDVVISEVMRQPRFGASATVAAGQWFEVYNLSERTVDLSYWYVLRTNSAYSTDAFFIDPADPIRLEPGDYAVFCKTTTYESSVDAAIPLLCDYVWSDPTEPSTWSGLYQDNTFNLQRDKDRLGLFIEGGSIYGRLVDDVTWNWVTDPTWPRDAMHSMNLDPASFDGLANDLPGSWCSTSALAAWTWWTDGTHYEYGSPGDENQDCL